MTFGQKMRNKRKSKGISQQFLSKEIGIPQTTISDWENDKSLPNVIDAYKIANALECSIPDLVDELPRTGTDN